MDEFSQYLDASCMEETPSLENIEPTIASLDRNSGIDRITVVDRITLAPWEYGGQQGWSAVETVRVDQEAAPGKKGKRRSAECEKSMYAVFFKQQQPIIKSLNPSASFGQISRLIAAAWERVGEEQKKRFKVAAAAAKREEMRKRIALKTIQLCGGQY